MTKPASTDTCTTVRIRGNVEDDVIGTRRISRHAAHSGQVDQAKTVADPPCDVMVGARGIAANTNSTDDLLSHPVQSKPAAKDVNSADLVSYHRILGSAVVG